MPWSMMRLSFWVNAIRVYRVVSADHGQCRVPGLEHYRLFEHGMTGLRSESRSCLVQAGGRMAVTRTIVCEPTGITYMRMRGLLNTVSQLYRSGREPS